MSGFFFPGAKAATKSKCQVCNLLKKCRHPQMKPKGKGEERILLLGEAPSKNDDMCGVPLSSRMFAQQFEQATGLKLDRDCWRLTAVGCACGKVDYPQVEKCRASLFTQIKELNPKVIIPLGRFALAALIQHRWKDSVDDIETWRGFTIPDHELGAWIVPTFSVAWMQRLEADENKTNFKIHSLYWASDFKDAAAVAEKPLPPKVNIDTCVRIMANEKEILTQLENTVIMPPPYLAFDYETTGLKPHAKGHRIYTAAFADSEYTAIAFKMTPPIMEAWRKVLANKSGKIMAGIKFEMVWSKLRAKQRVKNVVHCTQLAAHVLDNRPGITSLKFQACVRYGVFDYSSELEKYLEADHANSFNQVRKAPLSKLLLYNGADSLLTFKLAMDQMQEMK